jgi:hypothetical protein
MKIEIDGGAGDGEVLVVDCEGGGRRNRKAGLVGVWSGLLRGNGSGNKGCEKIAKVHDTPLF